MVSQIDEGKVQRLTVVTRGTNTTEGPRDGAELHGVRAERTKLIFGVAFAIASPNLLPHATQLLGTPLCVALVVVGALFAVAGIVSWCKEEE